MRIPQQRIGAVNFEHERPADNSVYTQDENFYGRIHLISPDEHVMTLYSGMRCLYTTNGTTNPFYFLISTEDDTTIYSEDVHDLEIECNYLDEGTEILEVVMYTASGQYTEPIVTKTNTGKWKVVRVAMLQAVRCWREFSTPYGHADIMVRCQNNGVLALQGLTMIQPSSGSYWGWYADIRDRIATTLTAGSVIGDGGFTGDVYDSLGQYIFTSSNGLIIAVAHTKRVLQFATDTVPQFVNETVLEVID